MRYLRTFTSLNSLINLGIDEMTSLLYASFQIRVRLRFRAGKAARGSLTTVLGYMDSSFVASLADNDLIVRLH